MRRNILLEAQPKRPQGSKKPIPQCRLERFHFLWSKMVQHATKQHQEDSKHKTLRRSLHIRHVIYFDYIFVYSSTDCCLNPLLSLLKYFRMRQNTIQKSVNSHDTRRSTSNQETEAKMLIPRPKLDS